jgi:hypothetical protein
MYSKHEMLSLDCWQRLTEYGEKLKLLKKKIKLFTWNWIFEWNVENSHLPTTKDLN